MGSPWLLPGPALSPQMMDTVHDARQAPLSGGLQWLSPPHWSGTPDATLNSADSQALCQPEQGRPETRVAFSQRPLQKAGTCTAGNKAFILSTGPDGFPGVSSSRPGPRSVLAAAALAQCASSTLCRGRSRSLPPSHMFWARMVQTATQQFKCNTHVTDTRKFPPPSAECGY